MLHVTILTSDRARDPELWTVMWQGKAPPTLKLLHVYNLGSDRRVFIWDGETPADAMYMDRLNQVGATETFAAFDQTGGWQFAFSGDLEGIRGWFADRGRSGPEVEAALDLRARGHRAPNLVAARQVARDWVAEQEARAHVTG